MRIRVSASEKGKPVVRRGRKAYGPPNKEVAGLSNSSGGATMLRPQRRVRMQRHATHGHLRRIALVLAAMAIVGLLFASMVLAVLLGGTLPADARQLAKVEAELATVGSWGAVVNDTTASGGKALRWNKPATTGTLNFPLQLLNGTRTAPEWAYLVPDVG
jgi:hypothetical protein